MYSSLILSTFFFLFFSSTIAVFFIAKPSSIVVFVVQTKWTFNHEGRGHRSLIGVSRGIRRPHRDTSGEIARHSTFEISGKNMTTSTNLVSVHTNLLCVSYDIIFCGSMPSRYV